MKNVNVLYDSLPKYEPYIPAMNGYAAMDLRNWDGKRIKLTDTFKFRYESDELTFELDLHKRFVSDGGSIPKAAQWYISPFGIGLLAWFVHDGLYGSQYLPRWVCDDVMYELLEYMGVRRSKRATIHRLVSWFAKSAYKSHDLCTVDDKLVYKCKQNEPDAGRLYSSFRLIEASGKYKDCVTYAEDWDEREFDIIKNAKRDIVM